MIFDLYVVVRNFSLKRAHDLIGSFFWWLFFCVPCVCNHCHWTSQNHRAMMGLMSLISCFYDVFSSYRFLFSLMTSLTMMVLGQGYLVRALFLFLWNSVGCVSVSKFVVRVSGIFSVNRVTKFVGSVSGILKVGEIGELIRIREMIRIIELIRLSGLILLPEVFST